MLPLDSPRWSELTHAYGTAEDLPELLRQMKDLPRSHGEEEPWFSLWSSLAHQGDVYSASFAAVPHVIEALARDPLNADSTYFQFPAWVEICRAKQNVTIPADLRDDYFTALARIPQLVAACAAKDWDSEFARVTLASIAATKGQPMAAEAILELSPEVAESFLDWFFDQ